jgi:hypothetical protein
VIEAKRLAKKPVLIGSGADEHNVTALLEHADGVIVGSSLKRDGVMENPMDAERVRRFAAQVRTCGGATVRK